MDGYSVWFGVALKAGYGLALHPESNGDLNDWETARNNPRQTPKQRAQAGISPKISTLGAHFGPLFVGQSA